MKRILFVDGDSLELDDLLHILDGGIYEVKVLKGEVRQLKTESLEKGHELEPLNLHGEVLHRKIGMLSLLLLLNQSIKYRQDLGERFIERISAYINKGIYPCIHKTNITEPAAMGELALILSGERDVLCYFNGEEMPADKTLETAGMDKFQLSDVEKAFLANTCCVSTALAVWTLKEAEKLAKTADICVAMNLEAIRGETGAFDRRLHELGRPYPNQIISAENIRRLIAESEFTTEKARNAYGGDHGPRCQDAICIRAVPQTHGGVRDTIQWLRRNLQAEINSDFHRINPIIGYSIDLMTIALADLGNISERRSFRLTDTNLTYGLPMNLVGENPGFNHGFPVVQAAATAVLGELKLLVMPSTAYSTIDPMDKEYVCATYSAAIKALEVISLLNKVLAVEMLMAAQAMDLVRDKLAGFSFGAGTKVALEEFRKHVKTTKANRFAAPDMVKADKAVGSGSVLAAVENVIGDLM